VVAYPCDGFDSAEQWAYNWTDHTIYPTNSDGSQNTSYCLDDSGNGGAGSKVQIYQCNGTAAQKWYWTYGGTVQQLLAAVHPPFANIFAGVSVKLLVR
jgi:hypothetical protein